MVPGTSCGRTSLSTGFTILLSLPCIVLAPRIVWRMSALLELVKNMTILPPSALSPKLESSSACGVEASSMSLRRKISLMILLRRRPDSTSCFLTVVIWRNWLPTLITTSTFPLDFDNLVMVWNMYRVSVTTLIVSLGRWSWLKWKWTCRSCKLPIK